MGKLKQAMIEQMESDMPDMTMDEIIREDIFFRYGVDLQTAERILSLMRMSRPPETLYVHNPELYDLWYNEFLNDGDANFQRQLDLFEGRHYG
jgi:hypothetical protein